MIRPHLRAMLVVALLASLSAAAVPAHAAGVPEDECEQSPTTDSICAYVTSRVLRFGDQPGVLATQGVVKSDVQTLQGKHAPKGPVDVAYNDASFDGFYRLGLGFPLGIVTYRGSTGTLAQGQVSIRADYKAFTHRDKEDAEPKKIGLSCESASFLVCQTPPVWVSNRIGSAWTNWTQNGGRGPEPVSNVIGFATIESRPLIIKILNMTDQPLARSGAVRTNGLLRSERIADPESVAASIDQRTGVGYYHYYRDADSANSATFFYTFEPGTTSSSLTGGALEFTVEIAADGSTDASKCVPPTGLTQSVECSVTMLGDAGGTLVALVAVGV